MSVKNCDTPVSEEKRTCRVYACRVFSMLKSGRRMMALSLIILLVLSAAAYF